MIELIEGDVFKFLESVKTPTLFMHGCNTLGVMGAGVARYVKRDYYKAFAEYTMHPKVSELGFTIYSDVSENLTIANAITQSTIGRHAKADLEAIQKVIVDAEEKYPNHQLVSVKIGCGLGYQSWEDVFPMFSKDKGWKIFYL
jgi:hypothetical protein